MGRHKYLIIGGGMTADAAVRGIRELDHGGFISCEIAAALAMNQKTRRDGFSRDRDRGARIPIGFVSRDHSVLPGQRR